MDTFAAGLPLPAEMIFLAALLLALSGVPPLFLRHHRTGAQIAATAATVSACLIGLWGTCRAIASAQTHSFTLDWALPFGSAELGIDPLSAWFLIPLFLVAACSALYSLAYWPATANPATTPRLTFFTGSLASSMILVLTARNGVLFLIGWEIMALSAFFALVTEDRHKEVRRAGMIYLAATHAGTLALLVMFATLHAITGTFAFPAPATLAATTLAANVLFATSLFGFGMKAGIMPLHLWLPCAHANAPSHISALMSGVMLKMGIYGLLRVIMMFQAQQPWWGAVLLVAGLASAILGIIFATAQQDVKKLLAYSSIENIGIITTGMGMWVIGLSSNNAAIAVLGMTGSLLHVLNHSLFKSLMFMGAGAIIHATGTRTADLMGGLSKRMPATASLFLVGCVAICGLPPLNGFVSEFILYVGFFSEARSAATPALALGAPVLGVAGGLAALCFIKLYATVFFGSSRSAGAETAHEIGLPGLAAMGVLASGCLLIGLAPQVAADLALVAGRFSGPLLTQEEVPVLLPGLGWISTAGIMLISAIAALLLLYRQRLQANGTARGVTWDCGYLAPDARMQYSASSFAEMAVALFSGVIRPYRHHPTVTGYFPAAAGFAQKVPEILVEQVAEPAAKVTARCFSFLRHVQLGKTHIYVLYILITLVLLLMFAN